MADPAHDKLMKEKQLAQDRLQARMQREADEDNRVWPLNKTLTAGSIGLNPPTQHAPPAASVWQADASSDLARAAQVLTSDAFGCEYGGSPVEVYDGGGSPVGLLRAVGVLRSAPVNEAAELLFKDPSKQPLIKYLSEFAAVEGWVAEAKPGDQVDAKAGYLLMQLDDGLWGAIGPRFERRQWVEPDRPAPSSALDLLRLSCIATHAKFPDVFTNGRERGGRTQFAVESTRDAALLAVLKRSDFLRETPLAQVRRSERTDALAELLGPGAEFLLGMDVVYHRCWMADDGAQAVVIEVIRT